MKRSIRLHHGWYKIFGITGITILGITLFHSAERSGAARQISTKDYSSPPKRLVRLFHSSVYLETDYRI
jgi:hypothetical protein